MMRFLKTKYWRLRLHYYNLRYQKYLKLLKDLKPFSYQLLDIEQREKRLKLCREKHNFYRNKVINCNEKLLNLQS